jgi:type I restriction enzyme S subunit
MKWPQGWREVPFQPSLGQVVRGVTFSREVASDEPIADGIAVLRAGNIQERLITDRDLVWIPKSLVSNEQFLQKGDVVVCTSSGSAHLVGKAALLDHEFYGTFGAFNAVMRCDPSVLLPEYLQLWMMSPLFDQWRSRLVAGANIQNIRQSDLAALRIVTPPIPEQQRIVEVLREANEAVSNIPTRRAKLAEIVDQQLASTIARCKETDWIPLGRLVTSKYGTSVRADADENAGVIVLRIPNVIGGEVDLSDLKYVDLPNAELDRLRLTEGDVLIVRSNGNPDYVGRCAAVDEATALLQPVYASYLIRLRPDQDRLLGSFLAALLNSSVGRNAMRNAIRTTAGQSNLSADALAGIRIPVPSPEDQRKFAQVWEAAQTIRRQFELSERSATTLNAALITEALSGRLTAAWREQHAQTLVEAARKRDARLGAPAPQVTVRITEHAAAERRTDPARPRRQALIDQLSSFQHEVWNTLRFDWRGAVLADDPAAFEEFCTSPQTAWRLEGFAAGREEVRRALEQLAAMGLIRKMSLPRVNPNTGRTEYLTAFRPLREAEDGSRPEEDTALADAERLARELERRQAPEAR